MRFVYVIISFVKKKLKIKNFPKNNNYKSDLKVFVYEKKCTRVVVG
jgi:hypothetical protein